MGILDKLRGEFIDIVEWVDDSRHTLAWRFPRYHNEIKHGAELIVRPGQTAVFVHRGKLTDVFEPGHYTLDTGNLPILSSLQGWKHGFNSPFRAEVYFVATHQITELKWGTPNPVPMRDPDFGPIRIRAFGAYAMKADDPRALLRELVGTDSEFDTEEISVLMRSMIATAFADLIANTHMSVLDLAQNYEELSEKLRQSVRDRVDDEYGLDVPQLYIVNISVPEEVEKALDACSSMRVIGDMSQYQQYQLGQSMQTLAANPAGGIAGAGAGLGMGMALAGTMMPGLGGGAPPSAPGAGVLTPTPVAPPPPVPLMSWHVVEGRQSLGPFTQAQLAEAIAAGRLQRGTLVWSAGMPAWLPAGQAPELAALFAPPPPPIGAP